MDNLRSRLNKLGFQDAPKVQENLNMGDVKGLVFEKQICDYLKVSILVIDEFDCLSISGYANCFFKRNDAKLKNIAEKTFKIFKKEFKDYFSDDFDLVNIEF